ERQATLAERKKQAEATAGSPSEPPALAAPATTETSTAEAQPSADTQLTEAPVITPVAEAVSRSSEDLAATTEPTPPHSDGSKDPSQAESTEAPHDAASHQDASQDVQRPA